MADSATTVTPTTSASPIINADAVDAVRARVAHRVLVAELAGHARRGADPGQPTTWASRGTSTGATRAAATSSRGTPSIPPATPSTASTPPAM